MRDKERTNSDTSRIAANDLDLSKILEQGLPLTGGSLSGASASLTRPSFLAPASAKRLSLWHLLRCWRQAGQRFERLQRCRVHQPRHGRAQAQLRVERRSRTSVRHSACPGRCWPPKRLWSATSSGGTSTSAPHLPWPLRHSPSAVPPRHPDLPHLNSAREDRCAAGAFVAVRWKHGRKDTAGGLTPCDGGRRFSSM